MAELTVDLTYGTALIEAARERGKEQKILEDGFGVVECIEKEPDLESFIKYPGISAEEKKTVLKAIFGDKVCTEFMNFLYVLVDKRRAGRLKQIMKTYRHLLEEEEGVLYGTVFSVEKLSEERLAEVEKQTSDLMQAKVKLTNEIDEKLMAGIKVIVEGKIIDATYRRRFNEMASQMNITMRRS